MAICTALRDNIYLYGGNDIANGQAGDDLLVGGLGNDTLNGSTGSDLYIWSSGDGNDRIQDTATSFAEIDTLRILDVAASDVNLTQSGNNLLITIIPTGEVITDSSRFASASLSYGLEAIEFSDGVRVEVLADPVASSFVTGTASNNVLHGWGFIDTIFGLEGNDSAYGGWGDDTLVGGEGADYLDGSVGADVYSWSAGDDNDTINDHAFSLTDVDRLLLTDIASADVELTRAPGSEHMAVNILSTGETISVYHQYYATAGRGIEVIEFADGTIWSLDDILENVQTNGTTVGEWVHGTSYRDNLHGLGGNDTLAGGNGDDYLFGGGGGNDHLDGQNGSDTYVWAAGDGNDRVHDSSGTFSEIDRLILTDVGSSGVTLTRTSGSLDMMINVTGTGEALTIWNQYHATLGYGIEAIEFSDGVTWTLSDIQAAAQTNGTTAGEWIHGTSYRDNLHGLGGNDTLAGGNGDDLLVGGTGNDNLYGQDGADTFEFASGDGADTIYDFDVQLEQIRFNGTGMTYGDLQIAQAGTSATVTYGSDVVTLIATAATDLDIGVFVFV